MDHTPARTNALTGKAGALAQHTSPLAEPDARTRVECSYPCRFARRPLRDFANPSESLVGDINHFPELVRDVDGMDDEPWPDLGKLKPYNRACRCLPRNKPTDPWVPNECVGKRLRDGDLVDVARHLAIARRDLPDLEPTGRHGGVRVDHAYLTRAMAAAATSYTRCDIASDHFGTVFGLAPAQIAVSELFDYT